MLYIKRINHTTVPLQTKFTVATLYPTKNNNAGVHWKKKTVFLSNHLWQDTLNPNPDAELGKVTLKINGDEALSDESVKKSNDNKALNGRFFLRINGDEAFNAESNIEAMKR
jgi:hypothetical protein